MCDQTMPYAVGSWVWCKVSSKTWWPGKVVDRSAVPDDLNDYMLKKRNPIAIIHFERENSFECVTSMDKVCLYSCDKKLEFLKKGYIAYQNQLKNTQVTITVSMANFIEDVISVERELVDGDVNIFDQFKQEKDNSLNKLIKELFVTTKEQKKKNRKSLSTPKANQSSNQVSTKTPVSNVKSTLITHAQKNIPHTQQKRSVSSSFQCYYSNDCTFSTFRYEALKRHVSMHKATNDSMNIDDKSTVTSISSAKNKSTSLEATRSKASTSKSVSVIKRRKYTKNKKPAIKKIKLEDEILKDWDDCDEESMNESDVQNADVEATETMYNAKSSTDSEVDVIDNNYNLNEEQLPRVPNFESVDHESDNESDADVNLNKSNESINEINDQNITNSFIDISESTSDQINNGNNSDATTTIMENKLIDNREKFNDSESSKIHNNDETTHDGKDILDTTKMPNRKLEPSTSIVDRFFDNLKSPEWMIREDWEKRVPMSIDNVKRLMNNDPLDVLKNMPRIRKPEMDDYEKEPQPIIEVQPRPPSPIRRKMWVEVKDPPEKVYTEEELRNIPEVKHVLNCIRKKLPHNAYLTIEGAKFVPEKSGRSIDDNNE